MSSFAGDAPSGHCGSYPSSASLKLPLESIRGGSGHEGGSVQGVPDSQGAESLARGFEVPASNQSMGGLSWHVLHSLQAAIDTKIDALSSQVAELHGESERTRSEVSAMQLRHAEYAVEVSAHIHALAAALPSGLGVHTAGFSDDRSEAQQDGLLVAADVQTLKERVFALSSSMDETLNRISILEDLGQRHDAGVGESAKLIEQVNQMFIGFTIQRLESEEMRARVQALSNAIDSLEPCQKDWSSENASSACPDDPSSILLQGTRAAWRSRSLDSLPHWKTSKSHAVAEIRRKDKVAEIRRNIVDQINTDCAERIRAIQNMIRSTVIDATRRDLDLGSFTAGVEQRNPRSLSQSVEDMATLGSERTKSPGASPEVHPHDLLAHVASDPFMAWQASSVTTGKPVTPLPLSSIQAISKPSRLTTAPQGRVHPQARSNPGSVSLPPSGHGSVSLPPSGHMRSQAMSPCFPSWPHQHSVPGHQGSGAAVSRSRGVIISPRASVSADAVGYPAVPVQASPAGWHRHVLSARSSTPQTPQHAQSVESTQVPIALRRASTRVLPPGMSPRGRSTYFLG